MTIFIERPSQESLDSLDRILLDERGLLKVVSSEVYDSLDWTTLRCWCHLRAIYGLPTTELVAYLHDLIGGRKAIEIGSGNGALGRALGIPMTDNLCQTWPDVRAYYTLLGQPLISYPDDVEEREAFAAVAHYRPQVVIGSWVTQKSDGPQPGSMYGVDEESLLKQVETYVVFGSMRNHGGGMKTINRFRHRIIQEPWMRSRAEDSALFVWGGTSS